MTDETEAKRNQTTARDVAEDGGFLVGLGLAAAGLALWWPPAAFLFVGVVLMAVSALLAVRRRR